MDSFKQGESVKQVHVYGPADIDFSDKYFDMTISMQSGQCAGVPWVRAVHRTTGEVTMVNCAKCACIKLTDHDEQNP